MATFHGNYASVIPHLLKGFSKAYQQRVNLLATVNNDAGSMRAAKGELIKVNYAEPLSVTPVTPSLSTPPGETPLFYDKAIQLQHWDHVRFQLDDRVVAGKGGIVDQIPSAISQAADALSDTLNDRIVAELKNTGNVLLTTNAPLSTYQDIVDANKALSFKAPSTGRLAVFGRETEAIILTQPQFLTRDFQAESKTIKKGVIGQRLGYDFMPINVSRGVDHSVRVDGVVTSAVPAIKEGRDYAITVSAAPTGGKEFHVGDILLVEKFNGAATAGNDNTLTLVVSQGATLSGGTAQIEVRGGGAFQYLGVSGTFEARVLKIQDEAFIYNQTALTFVSRPAAPLGFTSTSGTVFDSGANISYTMEVERAHKITLYDISILYGLRTMIPEFSVRSVKIDLADKFI